MNIFAQHTDLPITLWLLLISATGGRRRMAFRTWEPGAGGRVHISTMQGEMPEVVAGAGGFLESVFSARRDSRYWAALSLLTKTGSARNDVVMLSWSLFQSRFSGDRTIVGKQVRIDSKPYTVVGVLPAWFTYPDPAVKVWIPYTSDLHAGRVPARPSPEPCHRAAERQADCRQQR